MTQQTKRPNLLPYLLVLLVLVGVYGFMNKPVEAEPSYAEVRELFESEQVSAFTARAHRRQNGAQKGPFQRDALL